MDNLIPAQPANIEHFVRGIPFKAHKITGFTPELFERYYEDEYGGSIRSLNDIEAKLAAARQAGIAPSELNSLASRHAELIDLVTLQEIFLAGLAEDGGDKLEDRDLKKALAYAFGGVSHWQAEFSMMADSQKDSPGWLILAWCNRFGRLLNVASNDGRLALSCSVPILALDLQEHVYSSDFGNNQQAYIQAYLQSIHWESVAQSFNTERRSSSQSENLFKSSEQISVSELHQMMQCETNTPLVLDIRHDDDRERYNARISNTQWRDSFNVAEWSHDLPNDRPVVVYCMYGFWVSQKVAEELRAEGIDARSLIGGLTAWRAMGLPSSQNG